MVESINDPLPVGGSMPRSKNLHYVTHTVNITQPTDATGNWADGVIQVDASLSEELGRTIRSGNQFRLVGYGANLKGFIGSGDVDVGFAGTAAIRYCPVTKNSVGAWQKMFKQWTDQKRLKSAVGEYVRYDDFEVGWDQSYQLASTRNSTIRMTGLEDTNAEEVVIYGPSTNGVVVSLQDFYDSMNPIAEVSKNPFGVTIKNPKFADKFPDQRELIMPTSFSAQVGEAADPDKLAGGLATGDIQWLPSDNHLSHMTGTLFYYFKGISPDTLGQIADELKLTITLVYEGWSSLAPKSRKSSKRMSSKRKARRS